MDKSDLFKQLKSLLAPEVPFYTTAIIYGVGVSVLTLGVPISVQSLVNTVAFGALYQPLFVLSLVLLAFLVLSGALNALQTYVIEVFQRHFYARTTSDIAQKLLNADANSFKKYNAEEIVNRYFDVMTVQKSMAGLLTGGVSIVLQTLVGLILLGFYHPYFLFFDLMLIMLLVLVWTLYYKKALSTAVIESKKKYKVASWLENIARTNLYLKSSKRKLQALKIADKKISGYLDARKNHFRQVFGQTIFLLGMYALMSAMVLGLGGYLVIIGELTLGQLVAAELIVTVILASFAKAGKHLESFYDLYAAIDKISFFYGLKEEQSEGDKVEGPKDRYDLKFEHVKVINSNQNYFYDLKFEEGGNYHIRSKFSSSKFVFLNLLKRLTSPTGGNIYLGGNDFRDFCPSSLRDEICVIDQANILQAPIMENLTFGLGDVAYTDIDKALKLVDLSHIQNIFDEGLQTILRPSGHPLWPSQLIRLEIAKSLIQMPKVLVLSEVFDQVEPLRQEKILKYLMESSITLIVLNNRNFADLKFSAYYEFNSEKTLKGDSFEQLD